MATIFPATPALNDTFESDGTTWKWSGYAWEFFSGAGTVGGGGDADNLPDIFLMMGG